ncbi:HNH endonuclease signature motif containing protein [Rhodoferax sp. TH121]|uniref:HNH endonuclease signature motif containing protein n=1 Tax=Rhodoferax sp. TH121 TaxID=2022803 RepID=UPI001C3C3932|nr:HNH endonuclease signature motif containing protein [Rhodoferax sp. TH121]
MKTELTAERLRELLHYDPETGVFTWAKARKGQKAPAGSVAGYLEKDGHWGICVVGRHYRAHRLAWLYVHGSWPANEIDHRNGIKTDNRITNLRDATRTVNAENLRQAKSNNSCGLLGVYLHKSSGLWHARIKVGGKVTSLKYHGTKEAAHEVYIRAKRELHEGCTI